MDKLREMTGNDESQLKALARVRGSLNAMFFSDIVTADEKFFGQFAVDPQAKRISRLNHSFTREKPSFKDWDLLDSYLKSMTVGNYELPDPMGK